MNTKIKKLEEQLPKNCCSFCKHLSLQGPDEKFRYEITCIMLNGAPAPNNYCEYFEPEYTKSNHESLDTLYLNFLETAIKIDYSEYLKSIHWQLLKEKALSHYENKCCLCNTTENIDVYHKIKNLGRENLQDVEVLCINCLVKK